MALYFCDSFDHYNTFGQMALKWTLVSTPFASLLAGRTGTAFKPLFSSHHIIPGGLRGGLVVGAWRLSEVIGPLSAQIRVGNGDAPNASVSFAADGTITALDCFGAVVGASTSVAIEAAKAHYIEVAVSCGGVAGSVQARVDGELILDIPNVNTGVDIIDGIPTNRSTESFSLQGSGGGTTTRYDDLYVASSFLGDVKVLALYPNAVGTYSDFTGVPSATLYTNVDEAFPSDVDHNTSTTVGHKDTFNFTDISGTGIVKGIQLCVFADRDGLSGASMRGVCRIAGTDYTSVDAFSINEGPHYSMFIWDDSPATGVAWTVAEINGAEFGYKYDALGPDALKASQVVLEVVIAGSSNAVVAQVALEAVGIDLSNAVVAQVALEAVGIDLSNAVVAQALIELLQETEVCDCPDGNRNIMY